MKWQSIKDRLTRSEDITCDSCKGTGKLKTKPLWVDLVLIGIILILMGLLMLWMYFASIVAARGG